MSKRIIKLLIFGTFHLLGLDRISLPTRKTRLQIFFAHRVMEDMRSEPAGALFSHIRPQALDKATFVRRLEWLRNHWRFIAMDEISSSRPGASHEGDATLTFDDAYLDFAQVIQPILGELEIPVTFCITVNALDQRELLWFDQVYSAMVGAAVDEVNLEFLGNKGFALKTMEHKVVTAVRLCEVLTSMDSEQRDEAVQELVEKVGEGPLKPGELYLSRLDLAALAGKPGVTIGSHTMSHPNLLRLSDSDLRKELEESKAVLQEITGEEVKHLSYPSGLWDERVAEMAQKCGYETACSTGKGVVGNFYSLPRINVGWWSETEFAVRTSRLWIR